MSKLINPIVKAKELYSKTSEIMGNTNDEFVKIAALMGVDMMIGDAYEQDREDIVLYWNEVKLEINNL